MDENKNNGYMDNLLETIRKQEDMLKEKDFEIEKYRNVIKNMDLVSIDTKDLMSIAEIAGKLNEDETKLQKILDEKGENFIKLTLQLGENIIKREIQSLEEAGYELDGKSQFTALEEIRNWFEIHESPIVDEKDIEKEMEMRKNLVKVSKELYKIWEEQAYLFDMVVCMKDSTVHYLIKHAEQNAKDIIHNPIARDYEKENEVKNNETKKIEKKDETAEMISLKPEQEESFIEKIASKVLDIINNKTELKEQKSDSEEVSKDKKTKTEKNGK